MAFPLTYLHLTLDHSKGQGQAHLQPQYLTKGDKYGKHCYCQQIECRIRPSLHRRVHI